MSRISKRLQRLFLSLCLAIEEGSIREDSLTMWRPITYRPNAWRRKGRISKLEERPPPNLHFGSYLEGLGFHLLNTSIFRKPYLDFLSNKLTTETHRRCPMLNASGLALFVVNKNTSPKKDLYGSWRWTCWCLPSFGGWWVWGMFFQVVFFSGCRTGPKMVQPNQEHVDKRTPFNAINLNH